MGKAAVTFVATNNIFKSFLDKTFENVSLISDNRNCLFLKIEGYEDFILNPNHKVTFLEKGILLEGYMLYINDLGMVSILIHKYE